VKTFIKITGALLILFIFMVPTIIKDLHHHEHSGSNDVNKINVHEYQHRCVICNFEFSIYTQSEEKSTSSLTIINGRYINIDVSAVFIPRPVFPYSLRAPPFA
jgi:hypothetical protein